MKYVVLSFDDGRKDFHTNALPVFKKYQMPATLNIVSDFIGKSGLTDFASGNHECLSWEEVEECRAAGVEIANHAANHTNELTDIVRGAESIQNRFALSDPVGFASPGSEVCKANIARFAPLVKNHAASYIRSGNQIRRDGLFHAFLYCLYAFQRRLSNTPPKSIYVYYNRRNLMDLKRVKLSENWFYPSVTCNRDNSVSQVIALLKRMPDNHAVIIMFHSVLNETDPGYGRDKWFNTVSELESLCAFLAGSEQYRVVTNAQLHAMLSGGLGEGLSHE